MALTAVDSVLAIGSGGLVGLVLGLIGGGGSILAVPLLVYVVGVPSPHVAIGTAAIAVGLNAAFGLAAHARRGNVKWPCALVFAAAGIAGSALGAHVGKAIDGQRLLALFGLLMMGVGLAMLRAPDTAGDSNVRLNWDSAAGLLPRLLGIGFAVGLLAGFFGIGGGFLIVPGLMLATGMPMAIAIGTSLVAVSAFGLTTAASYASSGFIDWQLVALVVAGGLAGSIAGSRANAMLSGQKRLLTQVFASTVIVVGVLVVARGLPHLMGG